MSLNFVLIATLAITVLSSFVLSSPSSLFIPATTSSLIQQPQFIEQQFDTLLNSTFPTNTFYLGDFYGFEEKCAHKNASFVQMTSYGNSIILSTQWSADDRVQLSSCVNVKDNYHLCRLSTGTQGATTIPVCVKIDDDLKTDGEFDIGINANAISCFFDDMEATCKLNQNQVSDLILVYTYPGEYSITLRNYAVGIALVLFVLCLVCVVSLVLLVYCCLIKRRKQKLIESYEGQQRLEEELEE